MSTRSDITKTLHHDEGDAADYVASIGAVSDSLRVIIPVSGETERNQVRDAANLAADPPTNSRPIYFHRTDLELIEVYNGATFGRLTGKADGTPFATSSDSGTVTFPGGTNNVSVNVTFPAGRFTRAPNVIPTANSLTLNAGVTAITTSGCTITVARTNGQDQAAGGQGFRYIAVQMQATSTNG